MTLRKASTTNSILVLRSSFITVIPGEHSSSVSDDERLRRRKHRSDSPDEDQERRRRKKSKQKKARSITPEAPARVHRGGPVAETEEEYDARLEREENERRELDRKKELERIKKQYANSAQTTEGVRFKGQQCTSA